MPRLYRGINFSFVIKPIFKIFKAYFSTSNEIQKVGMIIFVSGCLITRGMCKKKKNKKKTVCIR